MRDSEIFRFPFPLLLILSYIFVREGGALLQTPEFLWRPLQILWLLSLYDEDDN